MTLMHGKSLPFHNFLLFRLRNVKCISIKVYIDNSIYEKVGNHIQYLYLLYG